MNYKWTTGRNTNGDLVLTTSREFPLTVTANDGSELLPNGQPVSDWPAAIYLQSDPLPCYAETITIQTLFADQGWGNTGHSGAMMIVSPPVPSATTTTTKRRTATTSSMLGRMFQNKKESTHHQAAAKSVSRMLFKINGHGYKMREQEFNVSPHKSSSNAISNAISNANANSNSNSSNGDEELSNAVRPGSVLRIVLVSAPYPGYQCRCRGATITVRISHRDRYHAAITREHLMVRNSNADNNTVLSVDSGKKESEEERLLLSFVFRNAPEGVFANIVQYAFR